MSFVHGKHTVIKIDGKDISEYTNTSDLEITADTSDVTGYGKNSKVKFGGLKDGKASASGTYDNTAETGPRAVLLPLVGQTVELIRQTEGAGAGKPQDTVDIIITSYKETNPVADMVAWAIEMELSDDVDSTPQSA